MTDMALSSLVTSTSSLLSPLMSRLRLELVRFVSLTSRLLSPRLRFIILALSFAHSDSTYLLALGATWRHREEADGGGDVRPDFKLFNLFSVDFSSILGVGGLEEKLLSVSDKSGRDRLRFSLDLAVSSLKFFKA